MSSPSAEPNDRAWPYWMLRFIATDDEGAFWDLVWSVGGSPPYGGVSYEEAEAVYNLIEDYRGPGMACPESYAAVEKYVANHRERADALEAFRINDEVTSAPETYDAEVVARGARLADRIGHTGLRCLFTMYEAELAHRNGHVERARDLTLAALEVGLPVAAEDEAYARRMAQMAQNAVALTALSGDREEALRLKTNLAEILDPSLFDGDEGS